MPAYRSEAEAEVRHAAIAKLRPLYPKARVIHEINIGGGRTDVLIVDAAEIIALEVKSEKDTLDRLPAQIKVMTGAAHHTIVAMHDCHLEERETNAGAAHYEREGKYFLKAVPDIVGSWKVNWWVYPEARLTWRMPQKQIEAALPFDAIHLLWKDELLALCHAHSISCASRWRMSDLIRQLRWHLTGKEMTRGICKMLRQRRCVEADPPIVEAA